MLRQTLVSCPAGVSDGMINLLEDLKGVYRIKQCADLRFERTARCREDSQGKDDFQTGDD